MGRCLIAIAALVLAACSPDASPSTSSDPTSNLRLACLSLPEAECRSIATELLAAADLPGTVATVSIQAFGCDGAPCPPGFGARNRGQAWVELVDPQRLRQFAITTGVDGKAAIDRGTDIPAAVILATSVRTGSGGEFALGHCGLVSPIDFDGSLWDPVGLIDGDASESINASEGRMILVGAGAATFQADPVSRSNSSGGLARSRTGSATDLVWTE